MRRAVVSLAILWVGVSGGQLEAGQDAIQAVKNLYAAAAYEDAIAAIDRLDDDSRVQGVEHYKVFSLIALGRQQEAENAIERLISADPLYRLDPAESPPLVVDVFRETRERFLPELAKRLFVEAKATFERNERSAAIAKFESLLELIDSAEDPADTLEDLQLLASGYLGLSRALAAAPESEVVHPDDQGAGNGATEAGKEPSVPETPPKAIKQELPAWTPVDAVSRRLEFAGAMRVLVGADGRVQSAEMIRPVHAIYDDALLRATKNWIYQPATKGGVPTASELIVEILLRPPIE